MNKITIAIICIAILASCNKNTNNNTQNKNKKKSFFPGNSTVDYKNQLLLLDGSSMESISRFSTDDNFAKNITDTKITWSYFDSLYSEKLSAGENNTWHLLFCLQRI